ncbi:hypothetical protein MLD38_030472 [Melastoma candidum]|uniref:Uncharacterized protein n=1 Tax=Melastoma candidum TaxID=119954 RepID=A0ACB9MNV5_9MYRT|nr:hypothetical protein MLD38_030472 [Melastoma candidum]
MGPSRDPCFPAMSVCSQGALNDPIVSLKRRYEECRSLSQSQSDGDDSGRFNGAAASTKDRSGSAHRLPGKRRRRMKEKLRTLQELLPNCNKADQVGVLDEAIEYLKTLQQQFLVLSTGSPMYMSPPPPPVMLPAGIQQMYAAYPGQFPVASVPRGMSLGAGVQFPLPPGPWTDGLGLQQPLPCILPFGQSTGCLSARSLSPEYSRPTNSSNDLVDTSDDDLVDTSDESESSSDGRFRNNGSPPDSTFKIRCSDL